MHLVLDVMNLNYLEPNSVDLEFYWLSVTGLSVKIVTMQYKLKILKNYCIALSYPTRFFVVLVNSSSENGGIFIISRFSVTCASDFCPTSGASTPGVERMNWSNPTDGDTAENSGLSFAQSSNLPCINGTLVKTPMFSCLAESNIDTDLPSTS